MGDPVQNNPVKAVSPDPSAGVRKAPFKCPEGKYLDINEDGKRICLPKRYLGILRGDGMTCGEQGGFPCDFGQERFGIPKQPPPKDQFTTPATPEKLTKLITGRAEYSCKIRMPYTEDRIVPRDVSIVRIPNESEETTRARLEQAARELTKTITGCHDVKFERLQPIANGHTKSAAPHSKPTTVVANKCEGEWATRSVCRK